MLKLTSPYTLETAGTAQDELFVEAVIHAASTVTREAQTDTEWTDEELDAALDFKAASGAEVIAQGLTGLWKDRGITDSVQWVEEIRSKEHR